MPRYALPLALAAALAAPPALSCGFHNYTPQPTLVDRMLISDHIVLARPTPQDPFRFHAVTALEGGLDYVQIPDLVDTATRHKLASDPTAHVLFARDGAYGPWMRLAYVDTDMAPILTAIQARLPLWDSGLGSDRATFFANLMAHPDRHIHQLALRELDQVDYGTLRNLGLTPDAARLARHVNRPSDTDLRPIRILLLGFSDAAHVRPFLTQGVQANARSGTTALGAFATALIEHDGPKAVETLTQTQLSDPSLPEDSHEMIIEALAIHSQTSPAMQKTIATALADTLPGAPHIAAPIARQFGARFDWSHQQALSKSLKSGQLQSVADIIAVSQYLALATQPPPPATQ